MIAHNFSIGLNFDGFAPFGAKTTSFGFLQLHHRVSHNDTMPVSKKKQSVTFVRTEEGSFWRHASFDIFGHLSLRTARSLNLPHAQVKVRLRPDPPQNIQAGPTDGKLPARDLLGVRVNDLHQPLAVLLSDRGFCHFILTKWIPVHFIVSRTNQTGEPTFLATSQIKWFGLLRK